ncbi:MAG TPA: chromosome partitioning protein [Acidimicrobiia bacterium]|nr:chromosome partitioning protein [Acidimicrobiia bacterium]
MTVIALGSAKASPGVTTTAVMLAAAWHHPDVVIVEADPDGGDLVARYALPPEPGLVTAAAAARRSADPVEFRRHLQALPGNIAVVPGPPAADQAHAALAAGAFLADAVRALHPATVLVDCGRLRIESPTRPLLDVADMVLVVARPRLDEVHHLAHLVRAAQAVPPDRDRVGLVCVGSKPYAPDEVAVTIGVQLVGVVADDAVAADVLRSGRGSPRLLRRSPLARSAVTVAERLADLSGEPRTSVA